MRNFSVLAALALTMSFYTPPSVVAADNVLHLPGYLLCEACSPELKKDPNPVGGAREHMRQCSLRCAASGFELYSNGRWYRLDSKGAQIARDLLGKSKIEKGNYVVVDGTVDKLGRLTVIRMKEVPAPAK